MACFTHLVPLRYLSRMTIRRTLWQIIALACGLSLGGCSTPPPTDYTNFHQHQPRSILVLPPLNQSTDIRGTYGELSTVTMPLAEMGYYVFPVAVTDQMLKENGMPSAGEMHQISLAKAHEILGADAILYLTLEKYGTDYMLITSVTEVKLKGKLVDCQSGEVLWEGHTDVAISSGGGNLLADAVIAIVEQIGNNASDSAHTVSRTANYNLLLVKNHGLLYGPYDAKFGTPADGSIPLGYQY